MSAHRALLLLATIALVASCCPPPEKPKKLVVTPECDELVRLLQKARRDRRKLALCEHHDKCLPTAEDIMASNEGLKLIEIYQGARGWPRRKKTCSWDWFSPHETAVEIAENSMTEANR